MLKFSSWPITVHPTTFNDHVQYLKYRGAYNLLHLLDTLAKPELVSKGLGPLPSSQLRANVDIATTTYVECETNVIWLESITEAVLCSLLLEALLASQTAA